MFPPGQVFGTGIVPLDPRRSNAEDLRIFYSASTCRERFPRTDADLAHPLREVALHRARRDDERIRDLPVRVPQCGEPQDFLLARREPASVALPPAAPRPQNPVPAQGAPDASGVPGGAERIELLQRGEEDLDAVAFSVAELELCAGLEALRRVVG